MLKMWRGILGKRSTLLLVSMLVRFLFFLGGVGEEGWEVGAE